MPEELFELHVDQVGVDMDARTVASKLSSVLQIEVRQLEKKLVKVKLLHGRSEVLKSGLTKDKAIHLQALLKGIDLTTTIKAEWGLLPIEKIVVCDEFKCPSCGFHQEIDVAKEKICKECGIVKEKYELIEKRKVMEKAYLKQQKLVEKGGRNKSFISVEQRNADFLKKKRDKLKPKKRPDIAVAMTALLVLCAAGASGYMYMSMSEPSGQVNSAKILEVQQTLAVTADASLSSSSSQSTPVMESTMGVSSAGDVPAELGNPYSKLINGSSLPPIAMEDAPKYVNKLLNKKQSQLPLVDKKSLATISMLYEEQSELHDAKPDFNEIKQVASSISDNEVRSKLLKQASWQEVGTGVKTFDDFGIRSTLRAGEEDDSVAMAYKTIDLYLKDYRYKDAAAVVQQISDPYLQAVALNKIMDKQFYFDLSNAREQRDRIKAITEQYGLTQTQKSLVLGILYQADKRLGNEDDAEATFKKLAVELGDMMDEEEKVATLVQLSEDQREGLNFTGAQYFLDIAHQQLGGLKLASSDTDHLYGSLSQGYAKLFEFGQANTLMSNIKNRQEKSRIANVVSLIEKKSAL